MPRVESFDSIDIAKLRRWGARQVGYSGQIAWRRRGEVVAKINYGMEGDGVRLRYRCTPRGGIPEDVNEVIPIVTTATAFGGTRHWFSCPSCGRRCRLLYGETYFRCRLCRHARYSSQHESAPIRICGIRWRIRQKLEERGGREWPLGLDDGFPPKPPRMHWRTYHKLQTRDDDLGGRWRIGIQGWLERTDPQRPRCGTPTRTGLPCAQRPMGNGRCAVHGGKRDRERGTSS